MSTICLASMQHELLLKFRVWNGDGFWLHTFSPRVPLHEHPLQLFSRFFFVFVVTFDDLSNSEVLRQHAGDA